MKPTAQVSRTVRDEFAFKAIIHPHVKWHQCRQVIWDQVRHPSYRLVACWRSMIVGQRRPLFGIFKRTPPSP